MTVEHYESDLFGVEPEVPETAEEAIARAAAGGKARQTTIDTDSGLNPIQEDLGWREGSGTAYDNRPLFEANGSETTASKKPRRKRADPTPSGRDQVRFIVLEQGLPIEHDGEVAHAHAPITRELAAPALRATIAQKADGDKTLERALLRKAGLESVDTDK